MSWLLSPFAADFMVRALLGGFLVAGVCAVVGTWVVTRGMAFLGEAIGHGMLPGVAIATLLGLPPIVGGAVSAAGMSAAIGLLQRKGRLSYDTSIGLLFVGMLSLGIIIVSHSRSFATDATVMLFGDILAIGWGEIALLAGALVATLAIAGAFHRAFVAAAFDTRVAQTLGLRPQLAQVLLTALVTLAIVTSYQAVGSLLVVGMLLAPAVAAGRWTRSIPSTMALAAGFASPRSSPASSSPGTRPPPPAPASPSPPSRSPGSPRSPRPDSRASASAPLPIPPPRSRKASPHDTHRHPPDRTRRAGGDPRRVRQRARRRAGDPVRPERRELPERRRGPRHRRGRPGDERAPVAPAHRRGRRIGDDARPAH
jgi:zinc/manganese transport system permease protein/manganese/iron transport system permease protein